MSGSENTREHMERTNRDASLAHAIVHAAESYIAQDLDALSARVAALEKQGKDVGRQEPSGTREAAEIPSSGVAPASLAPPSPLVERMYRAWEQCDDDEIGSMRAALAVAAEELLGPVTEEERMALGFGNVATTNRFANVLAHRLAAAKEACRG